MSEFLEKSELVWLINGFLKKEGVECEPQSEDESTIFWSYELPSICSLGWISVHSEKSDYIIATSVNFGRLKTDEQSGVVIALLERNTSLVGVSYACEMQSLITVCFSENLKTMNSKQLLVRLEKLHRVAEESFERFIASSDLLLPLPSSWLAKGGFT